MLFVYLLWKYSQFTDKQNMWILARLTYYLYLNSVLCIQQVRKEYIAKNIKPFRKRHILPALIVVERHVYNTYHLFVYSP